MMISRGDPSSHENAASAREVSKKGKKWTQAMLPLACALRESWLLTSKLLAGVDGGYDDGDILASDISGILRKGYGAVDSIGD